MITPQTVNNILAVLCFVIYFKLFIGLCESPRTRKRKRIIWEDDEATKPK